MVPENDFEESEVSENVSSDGEDSDDKDAVFKKRKYEEIPSDGVVENGTSPKRRHKSDLYKPPTAEELNNLKETENLYNNNLFRLQIEELISEVNIKNKRKKAISVWLDSFRVVIENLPEYNDVLLSDIKKISKKKLTKEEKLINKLAGHPRIIKTDRDVTLKFIKPELIETFGLYENNLLPGPNLVLNINLKMPKTCFLLKDFLNNRYVAKRYYYLLYIMEQLKISNVTTKITVEFHEGNMLLPVLYIEPSGCDKTTVKVYVTPSDDYFKPSRFLPDQNNIKQDVFETNLDNEILKNSPTILYNSSLGFDVTLSLNNQFIKGILKDQPSAQEGIKLLCIWLKQREFNIGIGSFTEDLIVYFITYLFVKKKINKYMSSYQVIRNFWNFLGTTDLHSEPVSIGDVPQDVLESFKRHFHIICLDKSGCYNVAAFLNVELYKKVKAACKAAVRNLDDNRHNPFQQLFLTKFPFYLQYDLVIDLTKSLPLEDKYGIKDEEKATFIGYEDLIIVDYISKIIQRALGKRFSNFVPRLEVENNGYSIKKLFFGVNLNPDEAYNFIELGPALNDHVAAAEFREFWGHLASDRRFRDGSTNVAVHFKTNTIKGKRGIIKKILNFAIEEKLELKFKLYYDEFEEILVSKELIPSYPSGTNEETTLKIIKASDGLGKILRAMQMSLKITGAQGACDIFSFSNIYPPIPTNYEAEESATKISGNHIIFSTEKLNTVPRFIQPVNCVLQLEHSSKWPNDLEALRHIKTSFYLEISKTLQKNHNILSHVTPNFIDVLYEGTIFRYRLYIPKEITLVKKNVMETGVTYYRESSNSFQMEKNLNVMPKVTGALKGVQSLYPSFGPGTALIKRWLRSQLIDDYYFPDIVVDLLNASLYLSNPDEYSNTPQISFLRFLKFFSELDWNLQTVVVNFNDDITTEEITELESKLQLNREAYQPLYIVMPFDQGLSSFTKNAPTKEILHRVRELAKVSLDFFNNILVEQNRVGFKELFIPNYDGYNLLIHLHPHVNSRKYEQTFFTRPVERIVVEKYRAEGSRLCPIVDFNPVDKYLKILRNNYGKYAMFFHDSYGGNVIGVLWHPKVFESVDFKVSRVNASALVKEKLVFNMDAVIEDFYFIGKGLVKMIDKK